MDPVVAAAKDCMSRDYDRNCYEMVVGDDFTSTLSDKFDATCAGRAYTNGISDEDLRSIMAVIVGDTTMGEALRVRLLNNKIDVAVNCPTGGNGP